MKPLFGLSEAPAHRGAAREVTPILALTPSGEVSRIPGDGELVPLVEGESLLQQ